MSYEEEPERIRHTKRYLFVCSKLMQLCNVITKKRVNHEKCDDALLHTIEVQLMAARGTIFELLGETGRSKEFNEYYTKQLEDCISEENEWLLKIQ